MRGKSYSNFCAGVIQNNLLGKIPRYYAAAIPETPCCSGVRHTFKLKAYHKSVLLRDKKINKIKNELEGRKKNVKQSLNTLIYDNTFCNMCNIPVKCGDQFLF